ncbi:MAG: AIR synthase-related protein, partial [Ignavibacteriaceae bacterium]
DILIGYFSNGLHTNGYSLARKVLFEKYSIHSIADGLKQELGAELLKIHKSYFRLISHLKENLAIKGFSHITGGGIVGNTNRILPAGLKLDINWQSWQIPDIFRIIQNTGKINDEEMRLVFNLGIGLIAVVSKEDESKIVKLSKEFGEEAVVIGKVKSIA